MTNVHINKKLKKMLLFFQL